MEQNMHINVSIPVTITHVKENRKQRKTFFDTMFILAIFISLFNWGSFRSSNKHKDFFKNQTVIFISLILVGLLSD
jgi:hypothetical protein